MFIEILRQVMIAGEPASAGSVLDLPEAVGTMLIGLGKAIPAEPPKPSTVAAEPPKPVTPVEPTSPKASKPKGTKISPPTFED